MESQPMLQPIDQRGTVVTRSGDIRDAWSRRVVRDPLTNQEPPVHAITRPATVLGVALVLCGIGAGYHQATEATMVCHVTGKERVYGMDGQVRAWRLDTSDCGVLDVDEVLLYGAWEPDRVYQSIQAGGTYKLTTTGWNPIVINAEPHSEVGE